MGRTFLILCGLVACNPEPEAPTQQVGYRDGITVDGNSGERGSIKISEVLWSGSVTNDGDWDPTDVFIELRNESARPMDLSNWIIDLTGTARVSWRIPEGAVVPVGRHAFIAAKSTGCFPEPDWVIPELKLPNGDPFQLTLRDADERLIEPAGSRDMPPFAGGYDLVVSRSMEKVEMMFGGRGTDPHAWHHYTPAPVDVPNNDRVAEHCRVRTLASPGRPNSPDYSGSLSSGSLE